MQIGRHIIAEIAPLLMMWVSFSSLDAGDWPQWLGPDRTGVSDETVAPWTGELKPDWKQPVGNGYAVPVVSDGILFAHAAVAEADDKEEVVAFDALTGDIKWRKSYPRASYRSQLGSGPRATPSVVEKKLYAIGITGELSCFDVTNGNQLWQVNPYKELEAPAPAFGVCASPVVVEGKVILPVGGTGSGAVAYDIHSGKLAWKTLDEPAGSASPVVVRTTGEHPQTQVVVQTTLKLAALNPQDGSLQWQHPLVFEPSGVSPTPLVMGDKLICSTQDTGTLTLTIPPAKTAAAAQAWWKQDLTSYFSTGTIDAAGRVYLVSNAMQPIPRADLLCVDGQNGNVLWTQKALGYFHLGLIRLADGKLLLLDDAGQLTLAEVNATGFKELCKAKVCGGTFSNPVLAHGRVYVRDAAGVACYDLRNATAPAVPRE